MKLVTSEITTENGFLRRTLHPPKANPTHGIPLNVDFEWIGQAFGLSEDAAKAIQSHLWRAGYVEPYDFMQTGVYDAVASALSRVLDLSKREAARIGTRIINLARDLVED